MHSLLPFVRTFAAAHPDVAVEVRRVPSRRMAGELLDRSLDFGVMTFLPREAGLQAITLAHDELVLLTHPLHPLAKRKRVSLEEVGRQVVIAHNDPSPARERVLRLYERKHAAINIQIALPSLDGIKRAVELGVGVAVLPRRCALMEIERGDLAAVKVPGLSGKQVVRFVFRKRRGHVPRGGSVSSADEVARHVWQAVGDGTNFVVAFEQQAGGIPAAGQECIARRGGQRQSGSPDCPP